FCPFSKHSVCVHLTLFFVAVHSFYLKVIAMSDKQSVVKTKGELKQRHYRLCTPPCPHYITGGNTHSLCVVCLGAKHAESALEGADCPHCERLSLYTLCSRRLSLRREPSPAFSVVSCPRGECSTLHVSSSEEVDVEDVNEAGDSPSQSVQYEELVEVVTHAVVKLKLQWPAEKPLEPARSKLDERFLRSKPPPSRQGLLFFSPIFTPRCLDRGESHSWPTFTALATLHYSSVVGAVERGHGVMPRVEQTLTGYLSHSSLAPSWPTKPLRTTSLLVGKGYSSAGQAGACLHIM
ncbi:hypothetical protein M9458_017250, partial [Cirrhinus mrigala]